MDAKVLKKVRNVRTQRRALLVDKWQVRVGWALGKGRRGFHLIGVVMEKPQAKMKGEEDARAPEDGMKRCWNWEEEERHSL